MASPASSTRRAWLRWGFRRTARSPTRTRRFRWPIWSATTSGRSSWPSKLRWGRGAGRSGQHVVVVNPSTPVGEMDVKPTPTGRIVLDFLKKKFPAYVDTGLNLVDATECARGHVAALEQGRSGERYILGGENLTLKQILDKLAAITGLPSPSVKVPHFVALGAAVVDENWTG